jgi:UDPglucose 6-dehydrogenase
MHVSIVGTGYVGLVTGLCLAEQGHRVVCVDVDADKIGRLADGVLPVYEPGLGELLDRHLGTRFFPTTDLQKAVAESELTMITVGTPIEDGAISLRFVESAADAIGRALRQKPDYHVVVVKSTVVPGTTEDCVGPVLERASGKKVGVDIGLGMNPEFLREGEAVEDFQNPDRVVLGAVDARSHEWMARLYAPFHDAQKILTNARTAEMIKYASNALLATLISFSNEIGNLCSAATDVDVVDVLGAVHLDKRISPFAPDRGRITPSITAYLKAGCGFGGSCFPKDVRALIRWGQEHQRPVRLLSSVLETNEAQPAEVVSLLKKHFPRLAGVRVCVLGLAFKAGTDDVRESPALRVIPALVQEGAQVIVCDPVAIPNTQLALGENNVQYVQSLTEAIEGVDAIVLLTAWPEFFQLPELLEARPDPPVVIDGRRVFGKARFRRYEGIGLRAAAISNSTDDLKGVEAEI